MTYFQAYLLTRLDALQDLGVFLITFAGMGAILLTLLWKISEEKWAKPFAITAYVLLFLGIIIGIGTPTTKEAAFIYIAPAIVNNQDVQKTIEKLPELSGLGLEYLSEILKQEIKDTKKEAVEAVKTTIKQGKNEK